MGGTYSMSPYIKKNIGLVISNGQLTTVGDGMDLVVLTNYLHYDRGNETLHIPGV